MTNVATATWGMVMNEDNRYKHAIVKLDGKDIPLIGIQPESTQDNCDVCGNLKHISLLEFVDGKLICDDCRAGAVDY